MKEKNNRRIVEWPLKKMRMNSASCTQRQQEAQVEMMVASQEDNSRRVSSKVGTLSLSPPWLTESEPLKNHPMVETSCF